MKKLLVLSLAAILIFGCTGKHKNAQNEFTINATISGITDGKILLQKRENGTFVTVDSTSLAGGKFTLKGKITLPEYYYIAIGDKPDKIKLFVDPSDIQITVNADSLSEAKITGSATQDQYQAYLKSVGDFDKKLDALDAQYQKAKEANNMPTLKKLDSLSEAVDKEKSAFTAKYVRENPKTVLSPWLVMSNAYQFTLEDLESFDKAIDTSLSKSVYVIKMKERIEILKKVAVGQPAPDFTMNNTEDKPVSLSSFKGKYVLVDFWASWCSSCRAENPNVVANYQVFHKKGLEILGVSFDRKKEDWLKAIKDDKLTWNHVSDIKGWANAAGKLYGIMAIPANVLVDKDGKIIAKDLRGDALKKKLEELMK